MIQKNKKQFLCVLCIFSLLILSGCRILSSLSKIQGNTATEPPVPQTSREPYTKRHYSGDIKHFDIPLEERSRNSFDKNAFLVAFFEFKDIIESEYNEEKESELIELYEEIKSGLLNLKTDVSLAKYDYYLDVANRQNSEFLAAKEELYSSYFAKSLALFKTVFSTEYEDAFRSHVKDRCANAFKTAGRTVSEDEKAMKKRIGELKNEYEALISQSADDTALKELYLEIVNLNNEYARLCGYDNYADYAYAEVFSRDYTIDDIKAIEDEIINEFLPLYTAYTLYATDDGAIFDAYEENRDSEEEMLARLKNCVKNISPELTESLDHLIQNNLYDAEESQTKLPGSAFTQEIYSYNDAFIFISPNHTAADYITLIHEFGHYNRAYYTASGDPFSPKGTDDIEEIMSQGLQLLCYDYYTDYHEKYGSALAMQTVFQKMTAVLDGFAVNEAEYLSYTTADLNIEKLDAIWTETFEKYGRSFDGASWTQISQVFQKPFYYINYATSGLASFEIFAESRENFNTGIEKYMTITSLPKGTKFIEALNAAKLQNFFKEGVVSELSSVLGNALGVQKE